jgi:hypothetical protein
LLEPAGQERSAKQARNLLNCCDWFSYSFLTTSTATSTTEA